MIWLIGLYCHNKNICSSNHVYTEVMSLVVQEINNLQILLLETFMSLDASVNTRDKI